MDWLIYSSNIAVGVIVWALTKFGIPFVNRELHTNIPFDPATESELSKMVKAIWDKELLNHLNRHHALFNAPPAPSPTPATYSFTTATNTASPAPAATASPDTGVTNA